MHATLARRALGHLVPPKIATPSSVSGGSASSLTPLVEFYSKLPKGPAPQGRRGPAAWFLNAKNASGFPILVTIAALVGMGYTLDYQKHHKNRHH
ncbi:mitochondrial F1-F0 ATP synthase subunit F of fungi-domain-containing protein [Hysterangium stoloniferum]|nr:mitochondrial F1-F0 ATP synthase subunit F of fungi-domain-containing protein [Hysterangium stoloniferum]